MQCWRTICTRLHLNGIGICTDVWCNVEIEHFHRESESPYDYLCRLELALDIQTTLDLAQRCYALATTATLATWECVIHEAMAPWRLQAIVHEMEVHIVHGEGIVRLALVKPRDVSQYADGIPLA